MDILWKIKVKKMRVMFVVMRCKVWFSYKFKRWNGCEMDFRLKNYVRKALTLSVSP